MKLLDKYILKKFLSTYLFTVLIITVVVLIIHLSDNAEKLLRANVSSQQVISYYLDFLPWMVNSITPLTVFIATVFVNAQLANRSEIVAVLSSAISYKRYLVPYLIGATSIAIISFLLTGWVVPDINKSKTAFEMKYLKRKKDSKAIDIHKQVAKDTYSYVKYFDHDKSHGHYFTLERMSGTEMVEKVYADTISWVPENRLWRMKNWKRYALRGQEEIVSERLTLDTALNMYPKDFGVVQYDEEGLTLTELSQKIKRLEIQGANNVIYYEVEKYARYMSPCAILILCAMGVFISTKKSRGGTGYQVALGFLLCFVYIIAFTLSKAIAENGGLWNILGPEFTIWLPNLLFLSITLMVYRYVPR